MNLFHQLRACLLAGSATACLVLQGNISASAAPITFQGTAQDFGATLTAKGSATFQAPFPISMFLGEDLFAIGNVSLAPDDFSYLVSNNPYTTQLQLKNAVSVSSDPRSIGAVPDSKGIYPPGAADMSFAADNSPTGISNLRLDLLNTKTMNFALNTINLPRSLMVLNEAYDGAPLNGPAYFPFESTPLPLNLSGSIGSLYLEQNTSKAPTFLPDGPGSMSGTFQIPALLHASLSFTLTQGSLPLSSATGLDQTESLTLTGKYFLTGSGNHLNIQLLGSQVMSLPISGNYPLAVQNSTLYGVTASVDIASAALNLVVNYSLKSAVVVPEPGSVLLLAIGLVAIAPLLGPRLPKRLRSQ
jgi:hypothetical protein